MTVWTITEAQGSAQIDVVLGMAAAGDRIELEPGTYASVNLKDHVFTDYVTIMSADSGNPAVLAGRLQFRDCAYITVEKINVHQPSLADNSLTVDVRYCDHMNIYDCSLQGGNHCVQVGDTTNIEIVGNDFDKIRSDNIKFWALTGFKINDNFAARELFPESPDHVDFIQGQGSAAAASRDGEIMGNVLLFGSTDPTNQKVFQGVFLDDSEYYNVRILNNLIYTNSANGIYVFQGTDIEIGHNTVMSAVVSDGSGGYVPVNHQSLIRVVSPLGAVNSHDNVATGGSGQLDAQHDDPAAPGWYNDLYENALAGPGAIIEDFRPVTGGPADFGTGTGAEQRIAELLNASPGEPEMLTVTIETPPANGGAVVETDQQVTYTPTPGFAGDDSFVYRATNEAGGFDTATVNVTVVPPVQASDDTAVTPQDTPVTINVLANDV